MCTLRTAYTERDKATYSNGWAARSADSERTAWSTCPLRRRIVRHSIGAMKMHCIGLGCVVGFGCFVDISPGPRALCTAAAKRALEVPSAACVTQCRIHYGPTRSVAAERVL